MLYQPQTVDRGDTLRGLLIGINKSNPAKISATFMIFLMIVKLLEFSEGFGPSSNQQCFAQ